MQAHEHTTWYAVRIPHKQNFRSVGKDLQIYQFELKSLVRIFFFSICWFLFNFISVQKWDVFIQFSIIQKMAT